MQTQPSLANLQRINLIYRLIDRGMLQSITLPQRKVGAGRTAVTRRTPDLRDPAYKEHKFMPKILSVMSDLLKTNPAHYCGFDPTASSLHLGHMTVLSLLLSLAKEGYKAVALIGGVTSQLGDPQGKTADRQAVRTQILDENAEALETQIRKIFSNYSQKYNIDPGNFRVVNNKDWYEHMSLGEYMEVIASHVKMVDMLDRSVVASRLKPSRGNMKFSECIYQSFQAYDWGHLYKEYGCAIQVGGYDQVGNIEDGYQYIWKTQDKPALAGLAAPLVVTEKGEKLGKTSGNAIWLDKDKTTHGEMKSYLSGLSKLDLASLALKITPQPSEQICTLQEAELVERVMEEVNDLVS